MNDLEITKSRIEDGVLYATFDHKPLNLFGPELVRDLASIIKRAESGPDFRVIVFDSAIPDFFIAHADMVNIREIRTALEQFLPEPSAIALLKRMSELPVVTIAEIAGRIRGAGSEFALACDMRFASRERAIFGQPEVGVGLMPGAGAVQHLTREVGRGRAMEIMLGGEDFPADLAERYGWVNRALPDAQLKPFVSALAKRIASFPPAGITNIKKRVNAIALATDEEMRTDSWMFVAGIQEPTTQERLKILLEKGMQTAGEVEHNLGRSIATI